MSFKDTELIMYRSEDGAIKIDVRMEDETVWLSQAQMVELFQSSKPNISEHIKNIFVEGELIEGSVVRNFRTTAADGKIKYRKRISDLPTPFERDYLDSLKQAQKKLKQE